MAEEQLTGGVANAPAGGTVVCHNDVCLENVVFRDGIAVGLLDFDFAAPGRLLYDLAQMARMCVPVDDDVNAVRLGWHAADRPVRLRLVADAYGLGDAERIDFLAIMSDSIARAASSCVAGSLRATSTSSGCASTVDATGGPRAASSSNAPFAE